LGAACICANNNVSHLVSQQLYALDLPAYLTKKIPSTQKGNISGVVSERDYVCKIALLSKTSKDTPIKEISTKSANLIVASPSETVSDCMAKMLLKDIRHLPLLDEDGGVVGIVSIKDLVKAELKEKQDAIKTLSDFALGKGGHFSAE